MVNRIFKFIETLGITPTEFADKIGVSRAAISSIKTGRTQPTLLLVEKIKQCYPEININWLILGKGDLYEVTAIENKKDEFLIRKDDQQEIHNDINENIVEDYQAVYIAETPRKTIVNTIESLEENKESKSAIKSIVKVILLYSDGSFEEFNK